MAPVDATRAAGRRPRPGGRSARVRAAVLAATLELLAERGYERTELPEVARRAGVNAATVYRRWGSKARLAGEALLERAEPLVPTPDTGALRTDLERLLVEGGALLRTPPVRAMFEILLAQSTNPATEIAAARDRFLARHVEEARRIVDRAVERSELPAGTDPAALVETPGAGSARRATAYSSSGRRPDDGARRGRARESPGHR
jgi:AcrR family transcriptional regulator